ncbi:MAG: GNAT family N-acetyltransferase [Planctomycetota bacterium]
MRIRPYVDADIADVERMSAQIVREGDVFPFHSVTGVLDYWFSPGSRVYVAEHKGRVAGSYVIKPNLPDRCSHIANAGYMVDLEGRGNGIGSAMGAHSLEQAARLGYLGMQFNIVVATNERAVRLWKKLGFKVIGRVPDAFRINSSELVDVLIMFRRLAPPELHDDGRTMQSLDS